MTLSMLEKETKQKFLMHAKGIHHIVFKYYYARNAMWKSRKVKHANSNKVKLPYRAKTHLPTGWDCQCVFPDYQKRSIRLTVIKGRKQVVCRVKSIPQNIVEIELIYRGKYYLAIKYKEEDIKDLIQSDNVASMDLGEIHAITSIDKNGNCVIITNRKLRSLIRLKDKRQAELISLRTKCTKGSNRYKKLTKAIWEIRYEFDRKIHDAIHKQSCLFLRWCIANNVGKVYYGDLDSVTRNSRGRLKKHMNHKLNMWRFGELMLQITNKLTRYGIKLIKISERHTSQTCPSCGNKKKTSTRNYHCKKCDYTQHRDIVGAINILNWNAGCEIKYFTKKEYLQIQ